ncbi:hypothetical protein [Streptomyces sp. NPDC054838]
MRTREITGPALRARVALAWRTDGPAGPAAGEFLRVLRAALSRAPQR